MKPSKIAVSVCCALCFIAVCRSATWHVATNGTDGATPPWGESWDYPLSTLSNAVARAASVAGSLILVSNGHYALSAEIILTNGLICRGFSGKPADVVLDCRGLCRAFFMNSSAVESVSVTNGNPSNRYGDGGGIYGGANSVISNCILTLNNGRYGGGIRIEAGGVVADCILASNNATHRGGGAYITDAQFLRNGVIGNSVSNDGMGGGICLAGNARVDGCEIRNNIVTNGNGGGIHDSSAGLVDSCLIAGNVVTGNVENKSGGGIFVSSSSVYSNCTVAGNRLDLNTGASYGGGGICVHTYGTPQFYNCLLCSNAGNHGAGMFFSLNTRSVLVNCTIAGNTALNNAGGVYIRNGSNVFVNTILFDNAALVGINSNYHVAASATPVFSNCCLAPAPGVGFDGGGNTNASPLFVDLDSGKFQLQPGSPCVNAGLYQAWMAGARDLDGRHRLDRFSRIVDIGCYEYVPMGAIYLLK